MFDMNSIVFIGNDDSIRKIVSGLLYLYISKKNRNYKKLEQCTLVDNEHYNFSEPKKIFDNKERSNKWNKYFCFIKTNMLYVFEGKGFNKPIHVFFLEGLVTDILNFHVALKRKLVENYENILLEENTEIIQLKPINEEEEYTYYLYSPDKGSLKRWCDALNSCKFITLYNNVKNLTEENETLKEEIEDIKKLRDIDLNNKDVEINNLKNQIRSLEVTIENTIVKNKRLQIAAEVNIKSTDEMLQKKISELEIMHNQLGQKIEENLKLEKEVKAAKNETSKTLALVSVLEKEKKTLAKQIHKIITTYEDACEEPQKIALINFNTNERYQKLVINHNNLKEEVSKLNDRFFKLEDEYKEKIKTLKEVVEIGDIFDYLHKLILLCQTKIKYYEEGYKYSAREENNLKTTISNLIKETKVSETNARVCYIRHRSKILEERLNHYINRLPPSDYFYFACTTLRRLGWIFGEIEVLNPMIGENGEECPFYSYKDDTSVIPLREQIYYNEGLEGRSNYNIVNEVDVYNFPTKMCPYEQKVLSDNNYNYIKIKLNDLKKDFNILKKKEKSLNGDMISDLQWKKVKQNAFERLERNLLMLEKRTNSQA